VTGLPLPRFVSLRASEARARRGPGLDHRVDWLYRRQGLPLRVTAEHGHWRRVEDIEGAGGWVHYSLISGARTVIVTSEMAELRRRPDVEAPLVARLESGVLASLGECRDGWCRLTAGGHRGWAPSQGLWGMGSESR
jgi:SH3-like domain-containing protein